VVCSFLGADAPFPAGPFILAALLQAPVVLFFALYRGGKRYEIHFESFAERIAADSPPQAKHMREWVERYVARLEHYCRLAPYNWFNFYDFWGGAA
jgi:predicted LPLAT superfamily acyltransferase